MNDALRTQLLGLGYKETTSRCSKHPHASEGAAQAQLRSITKEQERKPVEYLDKDTGLISNGRDGDYDFHVGHDHKLKEID